MTTWAQLNTLLAAKDLEQCRDTMMVNDMTNFELHWNVTIKLIEIIQDQNAMIKTLKQRIEFLAEGR